MSRDGHVGSNPTVSARKRRYVEVYRHSAAFYSPDADSIFLALPPAFGKFCGQGQGFFHRGGAQLFRLGIQMGVDVRRGGDVAVPQPFLNLLHGYPLFQQQAGTGVTKLVEATNGHSLVEAENAICYDIVRGYGLRRSLFGRRGVFLHGTKKQKTSVYRNV